MAKAFIYGVLKGTVTGHLRDADDDHYQILVNAKDTMFRIAVNVHSSKTPPDLRFQTITSLPADMTKAMTKLEPGFVTLKSQPGGLAQDFVRGGLIKIDKFKVVPGDRPGADNDLKDTMEMATVSAINEVGSLVYAFGARWGPEKTKKDKYFKFLPGNGIHNIHMNQGNHPDFIADDGVFHDGCLIFEFPGGKYRAFYLAFQSQSFQTDDKTGHAIEGTEPVVPKPPKKRPPPKKKKPAKKKPAKKKPAKKR
jgi:uncharacterized protein YukJ